MIAVTAEIVVVGKADVVTIVMMMQAAHLLLTEITVAVDVVAETEIGLVHPHQTAKEISMIGSVIARGHVHVLAPLIAKKETEILVVLPLVDHLIQTMVW